MNSLKKYIEDNNLGVIESDVSLKNYNTYKIEAKTKYLYVPNNIDSLIETLKYIKENNIKYMILGKGSNLIFNFDEYNGVMISLDKLNEVNIEGTKITVGAGYPLIKLAMETANLSLSGLEFASGIPGTLGGAIYMNAGAYKSDMSAVVKNVTVLTPELDIKTLTNEELEFGYRTSYLKQNKGYIVLNVALELIEGNKEEILELINDRASKRKESQPLEYPSAGSVFRNPENNYAGKLIEDQGLKGKNINGAEVSTKHANFIINTGGCNGNDIVELITLIKKTIKDEYDIELILEQEIVEK